MAAILIRGSFREQFFTHIQIQGNNATIFCICHAIITMEICALGMLRFSSLFKTVSLVLLTMCSTACESDTGEQFIIPEYAKFSLDHCIQIRMATT